MAFTLLTSKKKFRPQN